MKKYLIILALILIPIIACNTEDKTYKSHDQVDLDEYDDCALENK